MVSASESGVSREAVAPTTPSPMLISSLPLPASPSIRPSPAIPPAPDRLNTSTGPVIPLSDNTFAALRAVTS